MRNLRLYACINVRMTDKFNVNNPYLKFNSDTTRTEQDIKTFNIYINQKTRTSGKYESWVLARTAILDPESHIFLSHDSGTNRILSFDVTPIP